jgi:hypothetical protein
MNYQTGEGTRLRRQRAEQAIQLALQSRWGEAAAKVAETTTTADGFLPFVKA